MDFVTLVEKMHEASAVAGVDTMRKIEEAHARVALDLLGVPEGWPEGWEVDAMKACLPSLNRHGCGTHARVVALPGNSYYPDVEGPNYASAEDAMEAARRAVWAMEGRHVQRASVDRETLAQALHDVYFADATIVWGECCEDVKQGYLREADEAIRLCSGANVSDLEARVRTLTGTANAAVERAEKAEAQIQRLQDRLQSAENGREDFRKAYNQAIDDGNASVRRLMAEVAAAKERAEKAEADLSERFTDLLKRAEEAEVRAARAEKALKLAETAADDATTDEEDLRRDLLAAQTENRRLRDAMIPALSGARHIATAAAAAILAGEDLDNA